MQEYMLNKKDFAKKVEVAEQQYLRYESGAILPTLEVCFRIAKHLDRTIDEIWFLSD